MTLEQACARIVPPAEAGKIAVAERFSNIAIPLGSLGLLQDAIVQLGAILGTDKPQITQRAVVVFCADNGVVAQGVTQCGQDVTALVTENLSKELTTVCQMSRHIGATVIPVDIGVATEVSGVKLRHHKVAYGTADMTKGPAMTREQCITAMEVGITLAEELKTAGYQLVAAGEMGIGNTTTSAAVAAVLLGATPSEMTGRGAGLSSEGLLRKVSAIETAISCNLPDENDPIDVISKVGGFDIAGMCGFYLGCAAIGLPCVLDGFISTVAALLAVRIAPISAEYLLASHVSAEPAGKRILDALGKQALICANMRLGEGTGAVAAMALLDMVLQPYCNMPTFAEIALDAYQPLA